MHTLLVTLTSDDHVGDLGPIVYLAPDWPWPSTTGGRVRSVGVATALARAGQLTILAPDHASAHSTGWKAAVDRLAMPRTVLRRRRDYAVALARGRGELLERALDARLDVAFEEELELVRPKLVVLGSPYFGPFIDRARSQGAHVVLDAGESLVRSARSIALARHLPARRRLRAALDALAFIRLERHEYPRANQLWVAAEADAWQLRRDSGGTPVRLVPNVLPRAVESAPVNEVIRSVAFVGSYGHPPNAAAAAELMRQIMPAVRAAGGPRKLVLIGRDPTPAMLKEASLDPEVTVTGVVDDIAGPLREAGVMLVPLRAGAGTRIKILEAAALGVPIVSTVFGAEGLGFREGEEILYADTPTEFAHAVARLAADSALRRRVTEGAREVVRACYAQEAVDRAVAEAIDEIGWQGSGSSGHQRLDPRQDVSSSRSIDGPSASRRHR